jgi:uncharacterized protein YpmS
MKEYHKWTFLATLGILFLTALLVFLEVINMIDIKAILHSTNLHYYLSGCFFIVFLILLFRLRNALIRACNIIDEKDKQINNLTKEIKDSIHSNLANFENTMFDLQRRLLEIIRMYNTDPHEL